MNCTLCNTSLEAMVDDFYYVCPTCGAYVKDTKYYLSSAQEKERYEEHNNDVNDVRYQKFTSSITNHVMEYQSKSQIGLDYGCGTGPVISKQLMDQGFRVRLYDPYFYPDSDYMQCNYDYIFSCEVFEHFYQPKKEIEKLLELLNPLGRLYIMTHIFNVNINFKNWYYRNDPTHVFIFSDKTIEFIRITFNLDVEKLSDRLVIFKKRQKE